ncbi:MAG: 7-cyano-7-deazaguanine synthase QueC [Cocleimonas sp.]|nr:7-cyano-7-deazaguanine synthase QueC [Cocleimonas sp.]
MYDAYKLNLLDHPFSFRYKAPSWLSIAPVDAPGKKHRGIFLSIEGIMKALVVCSGGLDSVTLAYKVANEGTLASLLSFNYGQRHLKELDFARQCADHLGVKHTVIDLRQVGQYLTSALTPTSLQSEAIPDGHYAESSMDVTVVPNRNAIMMTIAYGLAASQQADTVAMAVHGGDHFIYADCRPAFITAFAAMQTLALEGIADVSLYTPFLKDDKSAIVREGSQYSVPFEQTWSCYKGLAQHCGRCGTCVERREAFHLAKVTDPTCYDDANYWQSVV